MKYIWILTASVILALADMANGQSTNWPPVPFAEVRAYLYNLSGKHAAPILDHGKINPTAWNPEGARLEPAQIAALQRAVTEYHPSVVMTASCYRPRHAFVFYDDQHKPVACLEVCFSCSNYRLWPEHPGPVDIDALPPILSELKIPVFEKDKTYLSLKKQSPRR